MNHPLTLVSVVQRLARCHELAGVMEVLREATRELTAAEGATVILRDGDLCYYADESAIAPLWKGRRFPMTSCVSGWCMLNRQKVVIADIYADERVPQDAYRPTFVKSLAMVPIRSEEPIGAIGAYWAKRHEATPEELSMMQALGDSASVAIANIQLIQSLKDANENKDRFLSMLAHELRNPLAPMTNALHLLEIGETEMREAARGMLQRQLRHVCHLVDGLLDVSRITRGRVTLQRCPIDLTAVIRESVDDRRALLEHLGLTVNVELASTPINVHGDATRLKQVVDNLLDNAGKFTPRGGHVTVTLTNEEEQAVVKVRDSGIGIDPEILPHVFDVFAQADRSLDRSRGGLGLGLSIAKGVMDLHGGTIESSSGGSGKGAEFIVRLDLIPPVPPLEPTRPARKREGAGLKILLVEDNKDSAESLRMLLKLYGHQVTVAHNGRDAVAAADEVKPEVLLCDIGLPDMDGFAVAKAIQENPHSSVTRLIAITGYAEQDDRQRTSAAGFHLHLVKPVEPEKLLKHLDSLSPSVLVG